VTSQPVAAFASGLLRFIWIAVHVRTIDFALVDYSKHIPKTSPDQEAGDSSPPYLDLRRLWEVFGDWASEISACGGLA